MIDATLLLLAGGASRRMGQPKALLPVAGTTLLEWMADRLGGDFEELLVSARDPALVPFRLRDRTVLDDFAGGGPLAGIAAGLAAARHDRVVAVACDMPRVTPDLLRRLAEEVASADVAIPRVNGRSEPVCACYRKSAEPSIRDSLKAGRLRASGVLGRLSVRWVDDLDPNLFWSLNTPEDYQHFRSAV